MTAGMRTSTTAMTLDRPVVGSVGTAPRGPSALAVAWLLLLAALLALGGYLVWPRDQNRVQAELVPLAIPTPPAETPESSDTGAAAALPEPEVAASPPAPSVSLPFRHAIQAAAFQPLDFPVPPAVEPSAETQLAAAVPRLEIPESIPAWQQNARAFSLPSDRPAIAVVVTGLGLSAEATKAAITLLPPEVTLSFTPYSKRLKDWIAMARVFGHEVMIDLPMEGRGVSAALGHHDLTSTASPRENLARLDWILSRGTALVGVAGAQGDVFLDRSAALRPVLARLRQRGLIFLDNAPRGRAPSSALAADLRLAYAASDGKVDDGLASRRAVDARLVQAENRALERGGAVVMAEALPVSIERITTWLLGLSERGVELAPITEIARRNLELWEVSG